DQRLDSLEPLHPAGEQKIRPRMRSGIAFVRLFLGKQRKNLERRIEPALAMHPRAEPAGRDKLIDVAARAPDQSRVTPPLRRAQRPHGALQTLRLLARPRVEFPKHVRRTNQPILVRRVKAYRAPRGGSEA